MSGIENDQRAEARLRHLRALSALTASKEVRVSLTEGITVTADAVRGVNAQLSEVIVDNLQTPLGTLASATLRGENIIAIEVVLPSNSGGKNTEQ